MSPEKYLASEVGSWDEGRSKRKADAGVGGSRCVEPSRDCGNVAGASSGLVVVAASYSGNTNECFYALKTV